MKKIFEMAEKMQALLNALPEMEDDKKKNAIECLIYALENFMATKEDK